MKIKKISSTLSSFRTINFNEKFNIIVGNPSISQDGVPHNLGKTTILKLLKFVCFDGSKDFLSSVIATKPNISFSVSYEKDGEEILKERSFSRRKKNEEKEIETTYDYTYFIRTQDELDVENGFRKPSFLGKDISWKPRLATLLGFNGELLREKLSVTEEIKLLENQIDSIRSMNSDFQDRENRVQLLEKQKKEINESIQSLLLFKSDATDINILVSNIDTKLNEIKKELYVRESIKRKISTALSSAQNTSFDKAKIEKVFNEIGLYFGDQLIKNFDELQFFYSVLYKNRISYLSDNNKKNDEQLKKLQDQATSLDNERSVILKQLANESAIEAFEGKHAEIVEIEKEIAILKQNASIQSINKLESELSKKRTEEFQCSVNVAKDVDEHSEKFTQIANIYSEIMKDVLKINAEMKVEKLSTGNLNFYVQSFRDGAKTEELKGDSAKKVSAAAIDLAIRCVQNEDNGFIAQDGVIDCLDKNRAGVFIRKVKALSEQYHFQYITTALKEKLPDDILPEDIVIELDDVSPKNLLMGFKY